VKCWENNSSEVRPINTSLKVNSVYFLNKAPLLAIYLNRAGKIRLVGRTSASIIEIL
jgi:hypothetical protein